MYIVTGACAEGDHRGCTGELGENTMFPGHPCDCTCHDGEPEGA